MILVAHKIAITRVTSVYVDLMEKQLTKDQITELMALQDDNGNTPVHLFCDASVDIIDRLIPYSKASWTIKNKK